MGFLQQALKALMWIGLGLSKTSLLLLIPKLMRRKFILSSCEPKTPLFTCGHSTTRLRDWLLLVLNYNNINAEMIFLFGLRDTLFCIQHLSCLVTWVIRLQGLFGCNLPIQFDIQIILFIVIKMTEFLMF